MILAAVHRVWRLLPRGARRRLFVHTTALVAPAKGVADQKAPRLPAVVAGVLSSATGLGESARMNIDGLRRAGLPFSTVDLSGSLLADADLPQFQASDQISASGPGTLIIHTPGSTLPYALVRCGRKLVQGKRLIGFWHWELQGLPADWRFGCDRLNEIWVPSQFCADAVRKSFAGPIRIIPHPVDVGQVRRVAKPNGKFSALTIFNMASGFERKNPIASVQAFKGAFGDDPKAKMIIKVVNPDHYPEGMAALTEAVGDAENIEILVKVMPRRQVMQLIAGADAVLSLHRSEGFGMLAAEAMLIGTPVIATDWSATAEFVTKETGMPIPCRLTEANDPQGCSHDPSQHWADADVDQASQALVKLRSDPDFAEQLAERARLRATSMFSMDHYVGLIRDALDPDSKRLNRSAIKSISSTSI